MTRSNSGTSSSIFRELHLKKLNESWHERALVPEQNWKKRPGGTICRVFTAKHHAKVQLELFHRGHPVSSFAAAAFKQLLAQDRVLEPNDLLQVCEILHVMIVNYGDDFFMAHQSLVEHAQVGLIHGRSVLAVTWHDRRAKRTVTSFFIDAYGDGETVLELHFSAPDKLYKSFQSLLVDTVRSLDWMMTGAPPVSSVA